VGLWISACRWRRRVKGEREREREEERGEHERGKEEDHQ
jgi:hypothetical protein